LQAALLLTLAATPSDPPTASHLLQLIWAWMHKPTFYPLTALLCAGPPLTWIAWRTKGRHRAALVCAWAVFLVILITAFGERTLVMLRILWWQVNR
jgi:hypothetical protein